MIPYQIIPARSNPAPILLSIPHCGTSFPEELKSEFKPNLAQQPDDTDWFVEQLYDFAPAMGITVIHAVNSRWVIDLNRDPQSKPLYTDGRIITGLCPTTTFSGESIYLDDRKEIGSDEVRRRLELYYWPYYLKVQQLLDSLKDQFGKVLLWDCHSIRHFVPTIHKEKFPDLILGDADGTSASLGLIEDTLSALSHSAYSVSHNYPFKGGYITRNFGKPSLNQHALQLEMTKVNYMDNAELVYDSSRAERMRTVLKVVFGKLIERMNGH
jgi:N-formylglutamate deformylase